MTAAKADYRQSQDDSQALARLLASILAIVDDGVVVFDSRGRLIMTSPSFMTLFGWRNKSPHAEGFASLFPDAKLPSSLIRLPRSVSAGRYTTRIRTGEDRLTTVDVNARWITQENEESYWVASLKPVAPGSEDASDPVQPAEPPPVALADPATFAESAARLLRGPSQAPYLLAGEIRLDHLDRVLQAAAGRQQSVAQDILAETSAALGRHLSAEDIVAHDGQGQFTICFGDATINEAERQIDSIQRELENRLTGHYGPVDAPKITAEVARVPVAGATTADLGARIAAKLAERRVLVERMASMTLDQVVTGAKLEPAEIVHRSGTVSPLMLAKLDSLSARALARIQAIHYEDVINQMDHLLLGLVGSEIYSHFAGGTPPSYVVPVSFATFTNRRLTESYYSLCRNLSAGLAQHVVFELIDVPDDAANQRIEEILARLRPFSRGQWLRVNQLDSLPSKAWINLFPTLTIQHRSLAARLHGQPDQFRAALEALHARRCRLIVHDVPDRRSARAVAAMGSDFVSGSGLLPWDSED